MRCILIISLFLFVGNRGVAMQLPLQDSSRHITFKDTARYTVLSNDKFGNEYYYDKTVRPSTLSDAELVVIEGILDKEVLKYNQLEYERVMEYLKNRPEVTANVTIYQIKDVFKYYQQFVPVTNQKGEKEVWVNCFCSKHGQLNWKENIVGMLDGGNCYFQLKINLTQKLVYYFRVNSRG